MEFREPIAGATDQRGMSVPFEPNDFGQTPLFDECPASAATEKSVYGGKYLNRTQRPWLEWWRPLYGEGPIAAPGFWPSRPGPGGECPGACEPGVCLESGYSGPLAGAIARGRSANPDCTNPAVPQFLLYGEYRTAGALNQLVDRDPAVWAHQLNLEMDLRLTATERFHALWTPLTRGNTFTAVEYEHGRGTIVNGLNQNLQTLFFEGDLGYMLGGLLGTPPPFDLPFTVGRVPLLFQNGIWMDDALLGTAVTIPARNSAMLDWSNFEVTFFAAFDELNSPAFGADDSVAQVFGATTFIESRGGYLELGYAFLDDTTGQGLGYHNVGVSYTRRYLNLVSNSLRAVTNVGQTTDAGPQTADGVLILAENSLLTPLPYNVIPYLNLFAGFDHPQSVARGAAAQGVLRNTGINFETDFLTNYPTLDPTGNNTYGGAWGVDLLGSDFDRQLIVEVALLRVMKDASQRLAPGDQYGLGARYQRTLNHAWLFRADAMYGFLEDSRDVCGARVELRHKF